MTLLGGSFNFILRCRFLYRLWYKGIMFKNYHISICLSFVTASYGHREVLTLCFIFHTFFVAIYNFCYLLIQGIITLNLIPLDNIVSTLFLNNWIWNLFYYKFVMTSFISLLILKNWKRYSVES